MSCPQCGFSPWPGGMLPAETCATKHMTKADFCMLRVTHAATGREWTLFIHCLATARHRLNRRSFMKLRFNLKLLLGALVLAGLAACGGGGGGNDVTFAGASNGTLRLALTDAPTCGYDAVNVTIQKVRVHKSSSCQRHGQRLVRSGAEPGPPRRSADADQWRAGRARPDVPCPPASTRSSGWSWPTMTAPIRWPIPCCRPAGPRRPSRHRAASNPASRPISTSTSPPTRWPISCSISTPANRWLSRATRGNTC